MSDKKIRDLIHKVLKPDTRIWYETSPLDKTLELNYTFLLKLIEDIDEKIIDTLITEEKLKEKFFVKTKSAYVFKYDEFRFFMEENKIDNSYTQYGNRIGLTDGKRFLEDTNDIVINFPYKDCVLEGGQSTEEGMDTSFKYSGKTKKYETEDTNRKEIFFNQVIASDEIDRLFDEKALVNWKRYTKNSEEEVKEIKRDENGIIKDNLIIKGNNLLALHSIKKQFAGKIKLIYIDPPYNTQNSGFKYNDKFNHSTWLTFMKNRLEVARELLTNDGSIYVNIDYNEVHYLKILMDEIFGRNNFQREIIWRIGWLSGYKTGAKNYIRNHDTILFYTKDPKNFVFNKIFNTKKDFTDRFNADSKKEILGKLEELKLNKKEREDFFEYISEVGLPEKYPLEDTWNSSVYDKLNSIAVVSYSGEKVSKMLGVDEIKGQKSEKLLQRIIEVSTNEGDIVLDYHIGTGTTCAVAHKIKRRYIGIEQMEYIENTAVARLKEVVKGEQAGISKSISWQGGGDFIYLELAKWNEQAKEEIKACKSLGDLKKNLNTLYEEYFLNYNVKIKEFKEEIMEEENFKKLSLEEQKRIFLEMLDLNQMYIQKTEMADKKFGINTEDQALTNQFYNGER